MDALIALLLAASAAEPALAGGPDMVRERTVRCECQSQSNRDRHPRGERSAPAPRDTADDEATRRETAALSVGDPIRLEPSFFNTPLAGGVGGEAHGPRVIDRHGVVIVQGRYAPRSASAAAAARGLPRS